MTTLQRLQAMRAETRAILNDLRFTSIYPVLAAMERQQTAAIAVLQQQLEGQPRPVDRQREGTERRIA